tara:strand:- start:511 stop:687 length:177 start_codon:yes stop_codon:yes gene_type:complete
MERQLGLLYVNVKVSRKTLTRQAASCKLQAASDQFDLRRAQRGENQESNEHFSQLKFI